MQYIQGIIYGLILLLLSSQTHASLMLKKTRLIYLSDQKSANIQAINDSEHASLVQSWIDEGNIHSTPETTEAPFIVTPPVTKIAAHDGTQLRIRFIGGDLPQDRESVFYLNVLDISPKPQNKEGMNIIQLALQIRIKVFYRPAALANGIESFINNVSALHSESQLSIKNPTPYFLNISQLYYENNQNTPIAKSIMIPPYSTEKLEGSHRQNGKLIAVYINDQGSLVTHALSVN
ncbi:MULTISPECIES: fimbrial biogenesis chaperone [Providencia]|uniref:fimbrial biogenesis chaperone n=1 Tax=Providencia TaxID=586 RepID=UPI0003E2AA6A|nr:MULTISPECIES: molecular chaperone [Providencia]ETS98952.1 PapD pilus/flagellar-assembly chaperone N-terminal domain protein [Providencia alcalifaciens PAL-3]EUC99434.1 PapD pilus/flagellar-assembly chaperone N-terminal domain protein [Providencia alcalifaciens PAL-1]MTB45166.1 fimbria/pilus periplasmic chaperone [Providencia sp. wls1950]MTC22500.1 fimbria/pilus periplasmic chaperone [Providencia sp. wls1938]MTC41118.1 fimbria/pilus periplasmic chaperone [Providencia sp. wls1921]